eukprot:m.96529 g.96529  ORF g.96529 m.96529 type:complete len:417 (+) comp13075_c0_seq7:223-1473(+)
MATNLLGMADHGIEAPLFYDNLFDGFDSELLPPASQDAAYTLDLAPDLSPQLSEANSPYSSDMSSPQHLPSVACLTSNDATDTPPFVELGAPLPTNAEPLLTADTLLTAPSPHSDTASSFTSASPDAMDPFGNYVKAETPLLASVPDATRLSALPSATPLEQLPHPTATNTYTAGSASAAANTPKQRRRRRKVDPDALSGEEKQEFLLKKERRMQRNREAASLSRKRRKEYLEGLESNLAKANMAVQQLQTQVVTLQQRNKELEGENMQLRRSLGMPLSTKNLTGSSTNRKTAALAATSLLAVVFCFAFIASPMSSSSVVIQPQHHVTGGRTLQSVESNANVKPTALQSKSTRSNSPPTLFPHTVSSATQTDEVSSTTWLCMMVCDKALYPLAVSYSQSISHCSRPTPIVSAWQTQ